LVPWRRDELGENFKSGRTTGQSSPSSPKVCDGAMNPWARTPNLQWSGRWRGEWRECGAREKKEGVGGKDVKCEVFLTVLPRGGGKRQLPG